MGKHLQPKTVCNATDQIGIAWLLCPDHTGMLLKFWSLLLEHCFFLQSCDENSLFAVPAVKHDLKFDMDPQSHKGSKTKLSILTVSGRESNTLALQWKRAARLQVESYRLKVLNSFWLICSCLCRKCEIDFQTSWRRNICLFVQAGQWLSSEHQKLSIYDASTNPKY